ncbi:TetR/AcrR family transcriptional regulator [Massilia sp. YIM B02443]|uniref:TetR/AcrR family transcriptional regulator n=1 Tax=Massilia sp. YIM B02443 TaxID=3050127 RepID=UPI0025B6E37E|nr:TetR/AcrR family transcriptional regulator [Massilia sp. YIM B02443]MDN4035642.1 TetR/AcrR family transcriptional regulator [Massilia sp. YIM B02443]
MSTPSPCTKSAGRPKASEVEARTQELIEAAGMLFLKNGYTKVSLEAIARQARVAVRTIYVKFGGKAGLLRAVLASRRERLFDERAMETDSRPLRVVIDEFAAGFHALLCSHEAMAMQRVVIAEAATNPELAEAFYEGGPRLTRETLARYFARSDIRAQLRDEVPLALLPTHLIGCISGDPIGRFLFPDAEPCNEEAQRQLKARLELFYHGVLKHP